MTLLSKDNLQYIESQFCSQEKVPVIDRKKWQASIKNIMIEGKKMANTFDKQLTASMYGQAVIKTRLNWKHKHHGRDHERRVSSFTDVQMLLAYELSPKWQWKASMLGLMLFPTFHDFTQIASISFNDTLSENELKLTPYQGHGETGALHLLTLKKTFVNVSPISQVETTQAINTTVLMILIHERSNEVDKAFQGQQQAFSLTTKQLIHAYHKNELDLFSLREKDIVKLALNAIKNVKQNKRAFITEQTPYGLHPLFEKNTDIQLELEKLSKSEALLFDFKELTDMQKKVIKDSVLIATNIAVNADNLDMIAPPGLSFLRTLTGSLSRERPLLKGNVNDIINSIRNDEEQVSTRIDSDVRRKWYEILEIPKTVYSSILSESLFITDYMKFLQWRSAKTLKEYTEILITGNEREISKYLLMSLKNELNSLSTNSKNEIFLQEEIDYILQVLKEKPDSNNKQLKRYSTKKREILQVVNNVCLSDIKSTIKKDIRTINIPISKLLPYISYISE